MSSQVIYQTDARSREQLKRLSTLLDSKFQLPFGWRIGWDGILGFIPGVGDVLTNIVSFYIVYQAAMMGCPPSIILKMAINILVDNLIDAVPILGNFFDFMWKANNSNVALLEAYLNNPQHAVRASRIHVFLVLCLVVAFFVASIALTYYLAVWLWGVFRPLL